MEGVVADARDLPDRDAGLGQGHEEEAEGVVLAAGQAQPVVREAGEEGVDLGAVQLVAAPAVGDGAGGEDVEVGAGLRFAEEHAAEGGAVGETGQVARLHLRAGDVEQGGADDLHGEGVQQVGDVVHGEFLDQYGGGDLADASASVLLGPLGREQAPFAQGPVDGPGVPGAPGLGDGGGHQDVVDVLAQGPHGGAGHAGPAPYEPAVRGRAVELGGEHGQLPRRVWVGPVGDRAGGRGRGPRPPLSAGWW